MSAKDKFVVVLDPGHGGGDTGTQRRVGNQDEKKVALSVALRLGRLIEWNYKDVKVVYTRKTDVYPTLPDRVEKAKEVKGDLFISIHVNACPDPTARGFETYVFGLDPNESKKRLEERLVEERENLDINGKKVNFDSELDLETRIYCQAQREKHNKQSMEFAKIVQSSLISTLKKTSYAPKVKSRGVKAKNLFVLCFAPMPSILVELGYMSNPDEERFIDTDEAQDCFANAIYSAFKEYKSKWDKRQLANAPKSQAEPSQPAAERHESTSQTPNQSSNQAKPQTPASNQTKPEAKPQTPATNQTKSEAKPQTPAPNQTKPEAKPQPSAPNPANTNSEVVWKIQFLTSDRLLKDNAPEFKGLKPVSYYKEGILYKYTYGQGSSTKQMAQDFKKVHSLFPEAFYVKFNNKGERIK